MNGANARLDLVGTARAKVDSIIDSVLGEPNLLVESVVDRIFVEIVDELTEDYFSHGESFFLLAEGNAFHVIRSIGQRRGRIGRSQ